MSGDPYRYTARPAKRRPRPSSDRSQKLRDVISRFSDRLASDQAASDARQADMRKSNDAS